MAIMTFRGEVPLQTAVSQIKERFPSTGLSVTLVDHAERQMNESEAHLLVFEKYFYRVKNYVSLSLMITANEGVTTIHAVGSGAGQGAIFRFGWGSEESLVSSFASMIVTMGFARID